MKVNKLSLKDKKLIEKYLGFKRHELSVYAFTNIYIWKGLFDIRWAVVRGSLCIFFRDKIGCFMYLAPLAKKADSAVVKEAFKLMDKLNAHPALSRIENVEQPEIGYYRRLRLRIDEKPCDYVCLRSALMRLSGRAYRHKRAPLNYFLKNYQYAYLPFTKKESKACLALYGRWAAMRKARYTDKIYQGMLSDSLEALKVLLKNYDRLNCIGRVVKIGGEVRAFTFGFRLNQETFCILYEITDLATKGLAQFIFYRIAAEFKDYKYINIMDDSGLENLKQVKLSYRPQKIISNFIVRQNG